MVAEFKDVAVSEMCEGCDKWVKCPVVKDAGRYQGFLSHSTEVLRNFNRPVLTKALCVDYSGPAVFIKESP